MKKKCLLCGLAMVVAASLLAGCSNAKSNGGVERNAASEEVQIDVGSMADKIKNSVDFKDEMSELEDEMFELIYSIDPEDIMDKKIYVSSGSTAEEIAVIKGRDKEGAERIKEGLEQRIQDQKESFESYVPEEMKKLEEPVLKVIGNVVILCVSDENDVVLDIIK